MTFYIYMRELFQDIFLIIAAPFSNFIVFWTSLPLLVTWLVLEIYFTIHREEALGWNTSLSNGFILFFTGMDCVKYLITTEKVTYFSTKLLLSILLIFYGLFIVYISFTHKMPPYITFLLASPSLVYYPAILLVIWTHTNITLTKDMLLSAFILYLVVVGFFEFLRTDIGQRLIIERIKITKSEE